MRVLSHARAAVRLAAILSVTAMLLPIHMTASRIGRGRPVVRLWYRWVTAIAGLRCGVDGEIAAGSGMLFVANHVSYFDIPILGALIDADFVARGDLADWPGIGRLARRAGTLFIDRRAGSVRLQAARIGERLDEGTNVLLFPEGTSSDGSTVLPFRSSLFSASRDDRPVQPVAIRYVAVGGEPVGQRTRPLVAWYGDMDFAPHFWTALGLPRIEVEVFLLPPVAARDRKDLAVLARNAVAEAVASPVQYPRSGVKFARNWSVASAQE